MADQVILIVDDEADLRDAIAFDLKRKGYPILSAGGGHEAFQIFCAQRVDLVITDVNMPEGNGVELLVKVKEKNINLPVFMFVGGGGAVDFSVEEAYEKGADAIFSKPFDRKELMAAVNHALLPASERFKRKDLRLGVESPVGIRFGKSNFSAQSKMLNIGRGGMFVLLEGQFPAAGEEVDFRLDGVAGTGISLQGQGVVRWVHREASADFQPGCGIEFVNLDETNVQALLALIGQIKPKSFIPRR